MPNGQASSAEQTGILVDEIRPNNGNQSAELVLIQWQVMLGAKLEIVGDTLVVTDLNTDQMTVTEMEQLTKLGSGQHIEDYPCWVELGANQLDDDVPSYLPNAVINSVPVKWQDWHDSFHTISQFGNNHYVPSNAWGPYLSSTVLVQLLDDAPPFTLRDRKEMQAIIAANP